MILNASLGVLLVPIVLGLILAGVGTAFEMLIGRGPWGQKLGEAGMLLVFSPFLSFFACLLAIPAAAWALRRGLAGWAVASLAGMFATFVVFAVVNRDLDLTVVYVSAIFGLPFGGLYWLSARIMHRDVFTV